MPSSLVPPGIKAGGEGDPGDGLAHWSGRLSSLFHCVPPSRERAQAVLSVLAAGAGAWLGELGREWKDQRSSAGAQHCGNHTVIYPVQKSAGCHVCSSKSLPNSRSNSILLSPGQKGALPGGLSSLSWREGAEGAFQVKFPSFPSGLAGSTPSASPTRATLLRSGGNCKWMGGFYESRHLSPCLARAHKSTGHKHLQQ